MSPGAVAVRLAGALAFTAAHALVWARHCGLALNHRALGHRTLDRPLNGTHAGRRMLIKTRSRP